MSEQNKTPEAAQIAAEIAYLEAYMKSNGDHIRSTRAALEAAAPHMLAENSAQALEDALIDFGQEAVFLTAAQETMARFLRERVAELRSQ